MARVKPFKGLRPRKELAEKITSPPYDVMNSIEAREMAEGNEYSFLHVVKPEIDLPVDTDIYDDAVYRKAKENLDKLIEREWMKKDDAEAYYIYRQKMGEHTQTGIVAAASVDDYEKDIIKKHEFTRKDKEDDRTRHVYTLKANTGPVFLTYKAKDSLDSIIADYAENNEPEYDFTSQETATVRHTFWVVRDKETIEKIRSEFEAIDYLYVADGHHRSAAGTRVRSMMMKENSSHAGTEEYNYFLSVIFPHDQMYIMDYNRVVKDLNGMDSEEFKMKVSEKFEIEETGKKGLPFTPNEFNTYGMYLDGTWYCLTAMEDSFNGKDPIESLDVAILQNNLLAPLLGIGDPRTDKRIDFVGGIRGLNELERLVDECGFKVAFSMKPTSIEQLMSVADAGKVMPPKSTWFEPKLRSGVCVHMLEED